MDPLDLLFQRLAQAVHRVRPEAAPSLTVGELLDTFAPYKRLRTALGLEIAEDYEVLVMRLVSGERGLIFADEVMQDDLKRELASGNPDLRALKTYRQAKVTLSAQGVKGAVAAGAPAEDDVADVESAPPAAVTLSAAVTPPAEPTPPRAGCRYCAQPLPVGRDVVFCPFCGQNLTVRRCAGCSAELEDGWKFCVACGRSAA